MKYAELKNEAGSYLIDDTYTNWRLISMQSTGTSLRTANVSGIHIEMNANNERVCTYPYLDYANGHSYIWPSTSTAPPAGYAARSDEDINETAAGVVFWTFNPHYYIGTPFIFPTQGTGLGHGTMCVRPTIWLENGPRRLSIAQNSGLSVPHMFAIASAMPNIVYTFTQYRIDTDPRYKFRYFVNLWQRAASVNLPVYQNARFSGQNVGYSELEQVAPYPAWERTNLKSVFKVKDNEKFQHWTFEQEARFSTMVFTYGIDDDKNIADKGEMIVKNERGEIIFNNRYDSMRILKYLPSINTLTINGNDLGNSPKRFSFPGRKIAVVALQPYCCVTSSPPGADRGYIFNTGFWFPDPSTVEFTTCATLNGTLFNEDAYRTPQPSIIKMAELLNIMILDVTGCTPFWRYETKFGDPPINML